MNNNLGMGVMIRMLGGNAETVEAVRGALNKKIASLKIENDTLRLSFEDGSKLSVWDGGHSCCEHRYMNCDDDLGQHIGAELRNLEVRQGPNAPAECDVHEVQFLVVSTSEGAFTVANHNEHNGYYGGFWVQAEAK